MIDIEIKAIYDLGKTDIQWVPRNYFYRLRQKFDGVDFESALDRILDELAMTNPDVVEDFRKTFKPELWYGKQVWSNTL